MSSAPCANVVHSSSDRPCSGVMRPALAVRPATVPLSSASTMNGLDLRRCRAAIVRFGARHVRPRSWVSSRASATGTNAPTIPSSRCASSARNTHRIGRHKAPVAEFGTCISRAFDLVEHLTIRQRFAELVKLQGRPTSRERWLYV